MKDFIPKFSLFVCQPLVFQPQPPASPFKRTSVRWTPEIQYGAEEQGRAAPRGWPWARGWTLCTFTKASRLLDAGCVPGTSLNGHLGGVHYHPSQGVHEETGPRRG